MPLGACAVVVNVNVAPGECRAAVDLAEPVDEESESSKPSQGKENVCGNVQHVADGWEHPYERQEGGKRGNDNSVDFAIAWSASLVDKVGHETQNYHGAYKFRKAEAEGEDT